MEQIEIFNIKIHNINMEETIDQIRKWVTEKKRAYVVTPNVDHVVKLQTDNDFKAIYRDADMIIADGMPIVWASRMLGKPLKERVAGSDLFIKLCEDAEKNNISVFLLGSASQAIIDLTAVNLKIRFPKLQIAEAYSPSFGFEKNDVENAAIVKMISEAKPDILFVGVGAPKQEKWIYRFKESLPPMVSLGVGASFDFVAGSVKRAPVWMQKSGLEWFYRFLKEPKRMFKRYFIDDFAFFIMTFQELRKPKK